MKEKFGFVRYDNQQSAVEAMKAMDGKEIIEGRKIQVELSHGMYWFIFVVKLSWRLFIGYFELNPSSFLGRNVEQLNNNTDHLY